MPRPMEYLFVSKSNTHSKSFQTDFFFNLCNVSNVTVSPVPLIYNKKNSEKNMAYDQKFHGSIQHMLTLSVI